MRLLNTILIFFAILFIGLIGCGTVRKVVYTSPDQYQTTHLRSQNGFSYISLTIVDFDDETRKIPAFAYINGVVFQSHSSNQITAELSPLQKGHSVEASFVGMHSVKLPPFDIKPGDSVVIKVKMKEDMSPIND